MPHANGKPLPLLKITTRPSSAPPGPRSAPHPNPASGTNTRAGTPLPGTPQSTGRNAQTPLGLGSKPKLDNAKISEMLGLNSGLPFTFDASHTFGLTRDAMQILYRFSRFPR